MAQLWQVTINQTQQGVVINNILHCYSTGADGDNIADIFSAGWTGFAMDHLCDDLHLVSVDCFDLLDPTAMGHSGETGAGAVSNVANLPLTVCANVGLLTGLRGRAFRGRTGLAGLYEAQTDDNSPNHLSTEARDAINDDMDAFLAAVNLALDGVAGAVCTASLTVAGAPRPTPLAVPVSRMSVASLLGTRRSRLT